MIFRDLTLSGILGRVHQFQQVDSLEVTAPNGGIAAMRIDP
jgi:hypothetical protein